MRRFILRPRWQLSRPQGTQTWITQFNLQTTPCLPLAFTFTRWRRHGLWWQHQVAAYYSFIDPEGWKAELAKLADLQRTVYPHKWSPVSCRSSAGQQKLASQRPTFYRWATEPTTWTCDVQLLAFSFVQLLEATSHLSTWLFWRFRSELILIIFIRTTHFEFFYCFNIIMR